MISESDDASLDDLSPEAAEAVEELTAQLANGEQIDLEAICQRYPAAAKQLRRLFPTVAAMASLVDSQASGKATPSVIDHASLTGTLGDFRLIAELGRGGMGIVYEAEQVSLGRRVALKVLPFAALLDPRRLQRFKNESQAAAMLKHPNIVSVYAVGAERGLHFYAMELIRGQSLAEVIAQLRGRHVTTDHSTDRRGSTGHNRNSTATVTSDGDLSSRVSADTSPVAAISTERGFGSAGYYHNVARLGIKLADALQYAHEEGVIHRDIKPSNLLLNERGEICIADFGLARFQAGQDLTVTGELLGTLRYMSPEQAEGRRLLDHRTDIYSLGLVLYELLTLSSAFTQQDRARLLRQILEVDPQPPRRLVSSVPRDLETVILKAIARQPEARYTSARELAMDLQRFTEHQPIRARRVSRLERCRWWIRRNPVLAGMFFLVLALLTFFAILGPLVAVRQRGLARNLADRNYVLSVAAAFQAWDDGDTQLAEDLLTPLLPDPSSAARHSFEAMHLWNRCRLAHERPTLKHPDPVGPIAYTHDGQRLTTAGWDGVVRIWDLSTRQVLNELRPETSQGIASLCYSPDESLFATGSDGGTIQIWDTEDLRQVHVLRRHTEAVRSVHFSPDGRYLASSAMDGLVLLWDVDGPTSDVTCVELGRFSTSAVCVRFSPDGRILAVSGNEPEVRIWSTANHELLTTLPLFESGSYNFPLSFSPDGKWLACGGRGGVLIWRAGTWQRSQRIHVDATSISSVAFSPDSIVLAASDHSRVRLYDLNSSDLLTTILERTSALHTICWSPDGKDIAASARDGSVVACQVPVHIGANSSRHNEDWYTAVKFIGTGQDHRLLVSHGDFENHRGCLSFLEPTTGTWDAGAVNNSLHFGLAQSPTSRGIIALGITEDEENVIRVWDARVDRTLATLPGDSQLIFGMAFSPDGDLLAAADVDFGEKKDSTITLWDLNRGTRKQLDVASAVFGLAFFSDGRRLAACGGKYNQGFLRIYDTDTGQIIHEFDSPDQLLCVAISPTESSIFAGGISGISAIWDLKTYAKRFSSDADDGGAICATYSGDGRTLAAAVGHGRIRLWDARTGDRLGNLKTSSDVGSLAFSDDDALLAAGCFDGSVAVWGRDGSTNVWHPAFLTSSHSAVKSKSDAAGSINHNDHLPGVLEIRPSDEDQGKRP